MELYIIISLICFIIILYFVDEIKLIFKLHTKLNTKSINNNKNSKNISLCNKILFMYYNPILLKIYKELLIELKKIKKYDYKSYYTHLNINLLHNELLFFDWFIIISGIIKFGQDTIIKLIKSKQSIPKNIINKINRLYNYYYFIKKSFKNIKNIKNKKYKNDTLMKLYKIEELNYKLFIQYYKFINIDKKFIKIIEQSIKDKNINTINSKFNIKFNKKNDSFSNLVLIKFFN